MDSPGSRSAISRLQAAPDQRRVDDDDHDQQQDHRRDDRLGRRAPYEHRGEQDDEDVHVVLAHPALGVHEVTGQGAGRAAVARVQRPRLAPPHGLVPAGPVRPGLGLLFLGARRGRRRPRRPGDRLAALGLGYAALGRGPPLGRFCGGTGSGVCRAVRALRARGILGRAVRRPGATASEHAHSLSGGTGGMAPRTSRGGAGATPAGGPHW